MSIRDIAKLTNTTDNTVSHAINRYFKKPEQSITMQSKSIIEPIKREYITSVVFDNQTGIYYDNCQDLAKATNRPHRTICNYISGERQQKEVRFIKV
jgi:hypothetical protein